MSIKATLSLTRTSAMTPAVAHPRAAARERHRRGREGLFVRGVDVQHQAGRCQCRPVLRFDYSRAPSTATSGDGGVQVLIGADEESAAAERGGTHLRDVEVAFYGNLAHTHRPSTARIAASPRSGRYRRRRRLVAGGRGLSASRVIRSTERTVLQAS